jgi:hypothetical protein
MYMHDLMIRYLIIKMQVSIFLGVLIVLIYA